MKLGQTNEHRCCQHIQDCNSILHNKISSFNNSTVKIHTLFNGEICRLSYLSYAYIFFFSWLWYLIFFKYSCGGFPFLAPRLFLSTFYERFPQKALEHKSISAGRQFVSLIRLVTVQCTLHKSKLNKNENNLQNCELFCQPLQFYGRDSLKLLDVKVVNDWVSMLFGGTVCFSGISVQLNTRFPW